MDPSILTGAPGHVDVAGRRTTRRLYLNYYSSKKHHIWPKCPLPPPTPLPPPPLPSRAPPYLAQMFSWDVCEPAVDVRDIPCGGWCATSLWGWRMTGRTLFPSSLLKYTPFVFGSANQGLATLSGRDADSTSSTTTANTRSRQAPSPPPPPFLHLQREGLEKGKTHGE